MLTTLDFADILSEITRIDEVYAGTLDGNQEKCLGVFNENHGEIVKAIGGKKCTKTHTADFSICIHWTDIPTACENQAYQLAKALSGVRNYSFKKFNLRYISCEYPFTLGRDERGICEYAVKFKIYYEESEE